MIYQKLKTGVFVILFFLFANAISGQGWLDSLYTKSQMISDLDSLEKTIMSSHPNPFVFCTEESFHGVFEESKQQLDSMMCLRDFAPIVSRCMNVMKDSHSSMDYGQLQNMQLSSEGYYMPLNLQLGKQIEGNQILLVAGDWENKIPKGSQLSSINGISADQLFQQSLLFSCVEGNALKARNAVAGAITPIITGLYNPYDSVNTVRYLSSQDGSICEMKITGYEKKEYKKIRHRRNKLDEYKQVSFKIDPNTSIGVLKVSTFSPGSPNEFRKTIRKAIRSMKKQHVRNLVIDLRNNGGGSSAWVEYLYSFLDSVGYNTPSNVIGKNSKIAMERTKLFHTGFGKFIVAVFYKKDEDVQSYKDFMSLPLGEMDTVYFSRRTVQPISNVFNGPCYLLINGLTASASVDFTNGFKKNQRGMIVGEQCLGPTSGTFGNPASYRLPETRLAVSIATIRYNYDNSFRYEADAIEPDFEVPNVASDMLKGEDTQLNFVKKLILEKK